MQILHQILAILGLYLIAQRSLRNAQSDQLIVIVAVHTVKDQHFGRVSIEIVGDSKGSGDAVNAFANTLYSQIENQRHAVGAVDIFDGLQFKVGPDRLVELHCNFNPIVWKIGTCNESLTYCNILRLIDNNDDNNAEENAEQR